MTVLAVTSIKGGVGKTTTAVNLAWLSARDRTPTLAWDLDPQGALSFTFRVRPELSVGCSKLLRDEDALADAIKGTDYPGLDLLPADFSYRKLDAILARADGKGRGLARTLRHLDAAYGRVLLDCPPGFSFLAENVFAAADALIVPTIPTVLSLRTLAQIARHVADRRDHCPLLLPFLNLVDRRKALHREIAERTRSGTGGWLGVSIAQASVIEQMAVERAPLGAFAPGSAHAAEFARLWDAVRVALERPADDETRRAAARALAADVDACLLALEPARAPRAEPPSARPDSAAVRDRVALRKTLDDDAALAALLDAVGLAHAPASVDDQVVHAFDTKDGAFRRAACALQLVEARGRFTFVARSPWDGEWRTGIDAHWACELLSGRRSPLDVVKRRLPSADAGARAAWDGLAGATPLERVASSRVACRRLTPAAPFVLEILRTERPGREPSIEIVVLAAADDLAACASLFVQHFQRVGSMVAPAPASARAEPAPRLALDAGPPVTARPAPHETAADG